MPLTTLAVGAAVTPTVVKTYVTHYTNRRPPRERPTARISYDQGLHLVRSFLTYASHHTVEELQAFTSQWVPAPTWVRIEDVIISPDYLSEAANMIIENLGPAGIQQVGGRKWWQWRQKESALKAEWVEMKSDYHARKATKVKGNRVMMYIHGGAYFFGSVDEHRYQIQRHARKLKARVLAPRYRLAPQFPFPCPLQDCLATYLYLLSIHDPSEIILAGDSAGGGMVVSILCLLRDQRRPLPAGAVLISPWVDLTHSFPSVGLGSDLDYIPPHGFMHRPSPSWPPPNDDEIDAISKAVSEQNKAPAERSKLSRKERKSIERSAMQGFEEVPLTTGDQDPNHVKPDESTDHDNDRPATSGEDAPMPAPGERLTIELDGKLVIVKDQVQMYATNQLISHPLVSPVLQPSLGGLPPLLVLAGGGEVLRDEQIYLAHKAANPEKYPLGKVYRARYDPEDEILKKYEPTYVQLQVWDDLCHVAPTLSFTRPAKFMYRSAAQFGAWALARAQGSPMEIVDDDDISVISFSSSDEEEKAKAESVLNQPLGSVGRAGDALPAFKNYMIRQRIDQDGNVYPLDSAGHWAALRMDPEEVGVLKAIPVRKWMDAKTLWDKKYAGTKTRVHKHRVKEMLRGDSIDFGAGERPPPSALAARTSAKHPGDRQKKSFGLAMWSMWGSKHDEATLKREEEVIEQERRASVAPDVGGKNPAERMESRVFRKKSGAGLSVGTDEAAHKTQSRSRNRNQSISMGRRSTIVSDEGQAGGLPLRVSSRMSQEAASTPDTADDLYMQKTSETVSSSATQDRDPNHLSPAYFPKFKTASHLQPVSSKGQDHSDMNSTRTGTSQISPDDVSTRAVFAAAGVIGDNQNFEDEGEASTAARGASGLRQVYSNESQELDRDNYDGGPPSEIASTTPRQIGNETPASRRSVERLQSHQVGNEAVESSVPKGLAITSTSHESSNRLEPLRSPSTTAVVGAPGIVGIVPGGSVHQRESRSGESGGNHLQVLDQASQRPRLTSASSTAVMDAPGVVDVVPGASADFDRSGGNMTSVNGENQTRVRQPAESSQTKSTEHDFPAIIIEQPHDSDGVNSSRVIPESADGVSHISQREAASSAILSKTGVSEKNHTTTMNGKLPANLSPQSQENTTLNRPGLYDRQDTDFQTALERI